MTCYHCLDLLTHMQKGDPGPQGQDDRGQGGHHEEEDRVTELPEIPQLQHLAKARPKRPKKHASSKNVVKVNPPVNYQGCKILFHPFGICSSLVLASKLIMREAGNITSLSSRFGIN